MAPKKVPPSPGLVPEPDPEPKPEDPEVTLARELRERQNAEDRRNVERDELLDRRRVEEMEQVAMKLTGMERAKLIEDPAKSAQTKSERGPSVVYVKRLLGNRAMAPQNFVIPIDERTTLLGLKQAIQDQLLRQGSRVSPTVFAPERQRLYCLQQEVIAPTPEAAQQPLKHFHINPGATVYVAVVYIAQGPTDAVPSKFR